MDATGALLPDADDVARKLIEQSGKEVPKTAIKCDMCSGIEGGPACVRACPTGAAIRVSPEKFLTFTKLEEVD